MITLIITTIILTMFFDLSQISLFDTIKSILSKIFTIDIDEKSFSNFSCSSKIVFLNDIIVYNFDVVDSFVKIVNDFFVLWHNIDFVNVFENKWMRIFFKFDWKFKIINKVKIYLLKFKNKEFVDKTFDDFHRIEKLFWINESTFFFISSFAFEKQ